MKGLFISFEGPDGAGKTTQINKLAAYFENMGKEVLVTREPGGTVISELIRNILLDAKNKVMRSRTELLLYAASRAQHVDELIVPMVNEGKIVICDRFIDSTIAYQGYGRGIELSLIEQLNAVATNGLEPDITFLLDIDVMNGLERVRKNRNNELDRLEGEKLEFHKKVRQGFLSLAESYPSRIKVVLGEQSPEKVFEEIVKYIKKIKL